MTDYVLLPISLALAALRSPLLVLRVAIPYLVLLALFVGFVLWNGSVVLGKLRPAIRPCETCLHSQVTSRHILQPYTSLRCSTSGLTWPSSRRHLWLDLYSVLSLSLCPNKSKDCWRTTILLPRHRASPTSSSRSFLLLALSWPFTSTPLFTRTLWQTTDTMCFTFSGSCDDTQSSSTLQSPPTIYAHG